MATNQVKTKWYSELYYEFDQSVNCCGLLDCGGFNLQITTDEDDKKRWVVSFTTIKEVAKDFRSNLLSRLKNYRTAVAQATTTTRERDKEINEVLALAGWKEVKRFRNQKTGNTVIMWTFSKRK